MFERASFGGHLHLNTNINQFWTRRRSARRLTKCIGLSYAGVSPPMGQLHIFGKVRVAHLSPRTSRAKTSKCRSAS